MFWIGWWINAIVALAVFCLAIFNLISDGARSPSEVGQWLLGLVMAILVLGGTWWLRSAGHTALATGIVMVLAVPALLFGLFMIALHFYKSPWKIG